MRIRDSSPSVWYRVSSSNGTAAPADLRIVEIDPSRDSRWDDFIRAHPDGLVYHHSAWLRTLACEYDNGSVALACADADGRLHGILPLAYTRGTPFGLGGAGAGRRLASLPRTPLAGPLGTNRAVAALLAAAMERVAAEPGVRLQIKPAGELDEVPGLMEAPWRMNYVLDLPDDPDKIRFGSSHHHARIKWAANKATKSGVHVRPAESEDELRAWYRLYLNVDRRRLQPPRPYRFFEAAWRLLRPLGMMRLLVAEQTIGETSEVIAGSVLLMLGRTVFYAFNGSLPEALHAHPNDLIQWHAIHQASAEGFARYDFGEVADANHDLAAFKEKWGTEARRLRRYYYPAPPDVESDYPSLGSDNFLSRAATAGWHHLPFAATTYIGDRVYRYF